MFQYIAHVQHVESTATLNRLARWGRWAYPVGDTLDHDDAMQHVYLAYLKLGQEETWAHKPVRSWFAYLKKVYFGSIFHRQYNFKVDRHTDFAEDIARRRFPSGTVSGEELPTQGRRRVPSDTRDIHLADLRIDLERGIRRALQRHDAETRQDLLALMRDIMAGYSQPEMRDRHGWSDHRLRQLMLHLKAMRHDVDPDYEAPEEDADKYAEANRLRAEELSYEKIGNRLGHSASWALMVCREQISDQPTRQSEAKTQNIAEAHALRDQGLKLREIAAALNVSMSTVKRYLKAPA